MDFDLKIKNKINKLFFSIRFININKDLYKKSLSNLSIHNGNVILMTISLLIQQLLNINRKIKHTAYEYRRIFSPRL